MKIWEFFMAVAVAGIIAGCGVQSTETDQLSLKIELDSKFTSQQKTLLKNNFEWFESFEVPKYRSTVHEESLRLFETSKSGRALRDVQDTPQLSRWYEGVFGGSEAQNALEFIDDRTAYYLSPKFYDPPISDHHAAELQNRQRMVAVNLGAQLFLTSVYLGSSVLFGFDAVLVKVNDPRVGIIQLSKEFFKVGLNSDGAKVAQLGVLVHEARHSDCNAEIKQSQLVNFVESEHRNWSVPSACTHGHVACPASHDYAGVEACDDHSWGAYGVSAVFAGRIAQCEDCSEEFKQAALMFAIDQASRVIESEKAFSGELGFPDMNHAPKVVRDLK